MTTVTPAAIPTTAGAPFAGGFYVERFQLDGGEYALIVAPKAAGATSGQWGARGENIEGARSCNNGLANTRAMAEAGSEVAQWALALNIDGVADWYLPSRDELELCYRHLKPTTQENYCSFRDGDNPSSLPAGYPYTEENPAQTTATEFQEGGPEAFEDAWYLSSTQYSPDTAWVQDFGGGSQLIVHKGLTRRAVAVRRVRVNP